jgi:glycosyltransferase involved in cell wall biosynthesis
LSVLPREQPTRARVFILLSQTMNPADWRERYERGLIADWSPYGYGHAQRLGCSLTFSTTIKGSWLVRLLDGATKLLLGFRLAHAMRNWKACTDTAVDVIWTHTEREFLPLLFLSWCRRRPLAPVIAQSIWLIDEWDHMWPVHRRFARMLMRRAAFCTFHSPVNAARAAELGLGERRKVVAFGVSTDSFPMTAPALRKIDDSIRIFAVGNDRHRDYETFAKAFCHDLRFEIFIATSRFPLPPTGSNWTARPCTHKEVVEQYRWADVVVVPLKANMHVSGLTSVLEAILLGKPVVVTDTGGLDWYFSNDEVTFCSVGGVNNLREAVEAIAANPEQARTKARLAQAAVVKNDLTSKGFALRHIEMTEALINAPIAFRNETPASTASLREGSH